LALRRSQGDLSGRANTWSIFLPKIKIEVVVAKIGPKGDQGIKGKCLIRGQIGGREIFVLRWRKAVRIRTARRRRGRLLVIATSSITLHRNFLESRNTLIKKEADQRFPGFSPPAPLPPIFMDRFHPVFVLEARVQRQGPEENP